MPSLINRRFPAEWEPHLATWMIWPCRSEIWTNGIYTAQKAFAKVANSIAEYEPLFMVVRPQDLRSAEQMLSSTIELVITDLDDSWARDTAPIWVENDSKALALDFSFNAWGNKFSNYENDQQIAKRIASESKTPSLSLDLILEGGSIHSNGTGTLLTTKECLLNSNRNKGLTQEDIEFMLKQQFGAHTIVWLDKGIVGDTDTDGHIDNIACFAEPRLILTQSGSSDSPNATIYEANAEVLRQHRLRCINIPEPETRYMNKQVQPLSYINFYIANNSVFIPSFNCSQDDSALQIISDVFPERDVIQLDANEILVGGGGIHCITMQQPYI